MPTNHRKQYRQVTALVLKAMRCLVEALRIVRGNGMRLAKPLEQRIASVEALAKKFSRLADGEKR